MGSRITVPSLASPERYESRPVLVTAMQWCGTNYLALREFLVHNLGPDVQVTLQRHGNTVRFTPREHLTVQLALNEVIMFTAGEEYPRFRITTESKFHAAFKLSVAR